MFCSRAAALRPCWDAVARWRCRTAGAQGRWTSRRNALRQHGRLIEAAAQQAPAMQRHRHDQVGVGEQLLAGLGHPAREQGDSVQPATTLEAQDEPATVAVVPQCGAAAVKCRRLGSTSRRRAVRPPKYAAEGSRSSDTRAAPEGEGHSSIRGTGRWAASISMPQARQRGGSSRSRARAADAAEQARRPWAAVVIG